MSDWREGSSGLLDDIKTLWGAACCCCCSCSCSAAGVHHLMTQDDTSFVLVVLLVELQIEIQYNTIHPLNHIV